MANQVGEGEIAKALRQVEMEQAALATQKAGLLAYLESQAAKADLEKSIAALTAAKTDLEGQIAGLQKTHDKSVLDLKDEYAARIAEENKAFHKERNAHQVELDKLKQQMAQAGRSAAEVEQSSKTKIQEMESKVTAAERASTEKLEQLKQEILERQGYLDSLNADLQNLKKRIG